MLLEPHIQLGLQDLEKKHTGNKEVCYHSTMCIKMPVFCLKPIGKTHSLFAFSKKYCNSKIELCFLFLENEYL